jgi:hypothetical protein
MAVMVNNNKKIIDDAEDRYIKTSTIYLDEANCHEKDNFIKFIDGDSREKVRRISTMNFKKIENS